MTDAMIQVYSLTPGDGCPSSADRRTVTIGISAPYRVGLASPFLDPLVGDGTGHVHLTTWATMPYFAP